MGFSLAFIAALYFCVIEGAGATIFKIHNKCPFTVWPAGTELKGIQLDSGGLFQPTANLTRGTFWGRTGCSFGGSCTTGDCGAVLNCEEGKGHFPATAFEYSLNQFQNQDFYDISVAGAFNLPMSIIPSNPNCKAIACSSNITANCPAELRVTGACMSACATFNTSQYCCTGNHSTTCSPSNYSRFFKAQCPQAYSYALDDVTSTFTCPSGGNYTIVFCGAATSSLSPAPSATSVTHPSVAKRNNLVLGITISGALIMALSMMVAIAVYWKKFRTKQDHNEDCLTIMVPNSTKSRAFTLREIMESTQNFNHKIGQGGFGSVFFGKLREGRDIAVKVLSLLSIEGVHQFQNEIDLLSTIHHKNLVSLLGYCNEAKKVMLIYEHMSEGSLRDHLYGLRAENSPLDWKTRLKIALDAAEGLEYLHMGCTPKIIHRDVKTANILLDRNMNGKLADFGLSRITLDGEASYANTAVKGTIGYLDPEYFRTQMLTEKSDVYSFGVVLLEMICGRPPINANLCEEELNLIQWVTPYVKMDENAGDIEIIIDKRLDGNYNIISITKVAKLAFRCLEAKPSSRPSVSEVATQIKEAIMHENENNIPLPVSEGIGIEHRDSQASSAHSRLESIPRKMEWSDNSSNLPQVGR